MFELTGQNMVIGKLHRSIHVWWEI